MDDSSSILIQISTLKDMLDKVNDEIEANIQITRHIESEIVKCEEIEAALAARESEDVLGIPMSMVTSELAFRTGGRVVDQYRCSLSSETMQALICTQDWLQAESENRVHDTMSLKESIPSSSYSPMPLCIEAI